MVTGTMKIVRYKNAVATLPSRRQRRKVTVPSKIWRPFLWPLKEHHKNALKVIVLSYSTKVAKVQCGEVQGNAHKAPSSDKVFHEY